MIFFYNEFFKILLLGETKIGKTSIIKKEMKVNVKQIILEIWETISLKKSSPKDISKITIYWSFTF